MTNNHKIVDCPPYLVTSTENSLNCWDILKLYVLQHKDEISLNVKVTKVEKKHIDGTRLNPKYYNNGQSAAKFRIERSSTTNN